MYESKKKKYEKLKKNIFKPKNIKHRTRCECKTIAVFSINIWDLFN